MRKQVSVNSRVEIARSGSLNLTYCFSKPPLHRVSSLLLGLLLGGTLASLGNPIAAQIVPDATLGIDSSIVTPLDDFGVPIDLIGGGANRSGNLFHSFLEFNINADREAYFFSPSGIQNILARVTGTNPSRILGRLGTVGDSTPNLFLINPNGIIFGQNARLDVGGSFVATTANAIGFGDRSSFSASEPQVPSALLTINPSAFFFNQVAPKPIINQSIARNDQDQNIIDGLRVRDGRSLLLVGGQVRLDGGFTQALGGRVEIGGVSQPGTVGLNVDGNNLRLSFADGIALADVFLNNAALVNTSGEGGGYIQVQGRDITLTNESAITADTLGSNNGGGIFLRSSQLIVRDGSYVSTGTGGTGQGGTLTVNATDTVEVSGTTPDGSFPSGLGANTFSSGAAGNLDITTRQLIIRNGAVVSAGTVGEGAGGNLNINASDSVKLIGTATTSRGQFPSGLFTQAEGSGNAGNLAIATRQLIVQDGAQISASSHSNGRGGNLTVNVSDSLAVIGTSANDEFASGLFTDTYGTAPGGNLTIVTGQLIIRDGARVSASTFDKGQGGTLAVIASKSVELSGSSGDGQLLSSLLTQTRGAGAAGDLKIVTGQLTVQSGALVSSSSRTEGAAGNLTVNASGVVEIIGTTLDGQYRSGLFTQTDGTGDAGDLTIEARQLIVRDGALLSARTLGQGSGGTITANASESVELIGTSTDGRFRSNLSATSEGSGDAGDLRINTGRLIVRDGAQAATGTFGEGQGGDLAVNASQFLVLSGFGSGLFAQTEGSGDAGNLRIDTEKLIIQAGARISTGTFAGGTGGDLEVNALESVELIGTSADGQSSSGLTTQTVGTGNAGNLRINTERLIVRDGAVASTGALSEGRGGTLAVTASESVELIGSGSGLSTETKGSGAAGDLRINTRRLIVRDEALVSARTFNVGQGGNVTIAARQLNVGEEAAIAVNSVGTGRAGNLEISSDSVSLENQGFIVATTLSGDGGNITLRVKDLLLMRHGSEISTTAGTAQAGGDGGNINIDAQFIVAVPKENSDITANAFTGRGGNINITTQGIYGLEFRPRLTPLSDITASSEFGVNGTVQINTPGVDPSRGLANLPVEPVNVEVAQGCQATGNQGSIEFFNTGRGGLASNPYEPLSSSGIWEDVPLPAQEAGISASTSVSPAVPPNHLVEAQGWLVNAKGEVVLIAEVPTNRFQSRCR